MSRDCKTCGEAKPVTEFSGGTRRECNPCRANREARRRQTDEARQKERRRSVERRQSAAHRNYLKSYNYKNKLKKYGLTPDDFAVMVAAQGGKCGICLREDRLYVDHDHQTGRVRGLLCASCNSGVGFLGDSLEGVERAVAYLRRSDGEVTDA